MEEEGVAEADLLLINSIASNEEMVSVVLSWIQSHRHNASFSISPSKGMREKFEATTVPSFAISLLNYIRSQTSPFVNSGINQLDPGSSHSGLELNLKEEMPKQQRNPMPKCGERVKALERRVNGKEGSATATILSKPEVKYEEEYPALGSVSAKDSKKKEKPSARQARRVNPTPTAIPEVDSSFVLANIQSPKDSEPHSNTNVVAVPGPLKVDMDALMDRFSKSRNNRHKERETSAEDIGVCKMSYLPSSVDCSKSHVMANPSAIDLGKSIKSKSEVKDHLQQFVVSNGEPQWSSEAPCLDPSLPSKIRCGELKRLATVHSNLIMNKMVPSIVGEVYFLLQLLGLESVHWEGHDKLNIAGRLFTDNRSCAFYACKTLEQATKLLDCAGEHILAALIEQPAISQFSPSLLSRLRKALAEHQSAALRSFKAYESAYGTKCALDESPTKFTAERPQKQLSIAMPASLPFQAARDSRNNFRTLAFQKVYNNREQCRDHFYAIIREAATSQTAFGFAAFGKENDAYVKLHEIVQSFSRMLMVENYPWFAELFVEQYLQASSYGETDPEVTGLVRNDAAKLQRLHDRLTAESGNQPQVFLPQRGSRSPDISDKYCALSSGNTWNKAKQSQSSNVFLSQAFNQNKENINFKPCSDDGFSKVFPQSTRMYILFLEAADSYRLNSQLLCSIRSKMCKLTKLPLYSRDVADIGSGFTQRVLSLKSLGSLMGFLLFYPEAGSLPPIPPEAGHEFPSSESDIPQCYPPIDLLEELDNARSHESLLLVLPWILDFLGMIKVIPSQASQPYFRQVFISLKSLYSLPMLDPSNSDFGVSSICILAALDGFFEDMAMLNLNYSSPNKGMLEMKECDQRKWNKDTRISTEGGDHRKSMICGGIDRMLGIIDSSYIQHCCPLLMGMRSVLAVANKGRKMQLACPQTQRNNYVRKITPIQNLRQGQSLHASNNMLGESTIAKKLLDSDKDQLKLKLQHVFLEQRPHLQRLVDFIVDTTAVNAARAAALKCVPQVLEDAMSKLQVAITDRFPKIAEIQGIEEFENMLATSKFEAATEHIISTAIQQVLPAAIEYAKQHSANRTVESLSALAAPDESQYVLSVAGGIASEAAANAVHKKTLANVSSEIRKRITRVVDDWRRKIQKQLVKESNLLERAHQEVGSQVSSVSSSDFSTSRSMNFGSNLKYKETTLDASTYMLSVHSGFVNSMGKETTSSEQTEMCAQQQLYCPANGGNVCSLLHAGKSKDGMALKAERIAAFCSKVSDCCLYDTLLNDARNSLRLHLASICNLIESMLSKTEKGLPIGGFDAIIFERDQTSSSCIVLDEANIDPQRIENGLIRRTVALSAYWCLIFPWTAFGVMPEKLTECCYGTEQNTDLGEGLTFLELEISQMGKKTSKCHNGTIKPNSEKLAFYQPTAHEHGESGFGIDKQESIGSYCSSSQSKFGPQKENVDCPMEYLVFMWTSLIKRGVCKLETIILEFFSPWRWQLALCNNPWDDAPSWFEAVVHGILKTIFYFIEIATDKKSAFKLMCDSFEGINGNGFCKPKNLNEERCQEKGKVVSKEARKLLRCISIELKKKFQSDKN